MLVKILVSKVGAEGKILARSSLICHMVVSTGKTTQLQISPTLSVLVGGFKERVFVRMKAIFLVVVQAEGSYLISDIFHTGNPKFESFLFGLWACCTDHF